LGGDEAVTIVWEDENALRQGLAEGGRRVHNRKCKINDWGYWPDLYMHLVGSMLART